MASLEVAKSSRARIVKLYKRATYCYALPFIFLILAVIGIGEGLFLGVFCLSLLPLAVTGLVFTGRGLRLSSRSGDYEKKDVGFANVILGVILGGLGLLALGLAYA
ncbi:hypothetical protein [Hymenobacter wooponensis]|uniref:DUF4190 domain-containing protein n=1 Tax=Hymenobacter wooponensis TaxID=1525360 RepID=A0A4Z0MP72_9BACT|nr:hypothetical protein [Hymenobacter wooponensis]TGD81239.1 hypothetical protein EU557_06650 [Hymenobacter wooponensis]